MRYFVSSIDSIVGFLKPSAVSKSREHAALVKYRVSKRLAMTDPRPDFMCAMLKKQGHEKLTRAKIEENSRVLIKYRIGRRN